MKLKNIKVGDTVEVKKSIAENGLSDIIEAGDLCKVNYVEPLHYDGYLTVQIQYRGDDYWLSHKHLRKPKSKQLDLSVFDGLDEKWQWAAIDEDGRGVVFSEQPEYLFGRWRIDFTAECRKVGDKYKCPTNSSSSLIKRETKELTGSDLCKAMLARGDKYVMCKIAREDYQYKLPSVVTGYGDSGFWSDDDYYPIANPINRNGEPLTQAEAGL